MHAEAPDGITPAARDSTDSRAGA